MRVTLFIVLALITFACFASAAKRGKVSRLSDSQRPVFRRPVITEREVRAAVQDLEAALEEWRVYGNAGNGGRWEAGFEYTSKDDEEEEALILRRNAASHVIAALDRLEEIVDEQWGVGGSVGSHGWNVQGSYNNGGVSAGASVGHGNGGWNANVGVKIRF